jgi:ELWxxDGT repeat protein
MTNVNDPRRLCHTRWQFVAAALVLIAGAEWAGQVSAADAQGPAVLVTDSNLQPMILPAVLPSLRGVGTTTFFVASTPTTGTELWKLDSTGVRAVLVKDINPGSAASTPSALTEVNGVLFFVADDGAHGVELWRSDGMAGGTVLFRDINPGPGSSFFSALTGVSNALTSVNGLLFFIVTIGDSVGLWRSDGTIAGTVFLTRPAAPSTLVAVDRAAFFVGADSSSCFEQTVWRSDGSVAGTSLVKNISPCSRYNLQNLTDVNGTLFFTVVPADNLTSGVRLWKSDGTEAGTVMVRELYPDVDDTADVSVLTVVDDRLLFRFRNFRLDSPRSELWSSDGTNAGTVLLKADIVPQQWTDAQFATVRGTMFFGGYDDAHGWELWKTDGTVAGTMLVKDIVPGTDGSDPTALTAVNGRLVFQACDPSNGCQVWVSDGTADGTREVPGIVPGGASAGFSSIVLNGSFIYATTEVPAGGYELWAIPTSAFGPVPTLTPTATFSPAPKASRTSTAVPSVTRSPHPPTATPSRIGTATPSASASDKCVGDCDADGHCQVNELVLAVNIALGVADLGDCNVLDGNGDRVVTVAELIAGVGYALYGCGGGGGGSAEGGGGDFVCAGR